MASSGFDARCPICVLGRAHSPALHEWSIEWAQVEFSLGGADYPPEFMARPPLRTRLRTALARFVRR